MNLSMDDLIEMYWDDYLGDNYEEFLPLEMDSYLIRKPLSEMETIYEMLKNGEDIRGGKFDFAKTLVGDLGDKFISLNATDDEMRDYGYLVINNMGFKKDFLNYCKEMGYTD